MYGGYNSQNVDWNTNTFKYINVPLTNLKASLMYFEKFMKTCFHKNAFIAMYPFFKSIFNI